MDVPARRSPARRIAFPPGGTGACAVNGSTPGTPSSPRQLSAMGTGSSLPSEISSWLPASKRSAVVGAGPTRDHIGLLASPGRRATISVVACSERVWSPWVQAERGASAANAAVPKTVKTPRRLIGRFHSTMRLMRPFLASNVQPAGRVGPGSMRPFFCCGEIGSCYKPPPAASRPDWMLTLSGRGGTGRRAGFRFQ
jgi:hypothetical protein